MIRALVFSMILAALVISACATEPPPTPTSEALIGMPNPASEHCVDQGYELEIRTEDGGGEVGYCIFTDGTECEEWAFFRGECAPGTPKP